MLREFDEQEPGGQFTEPEEVEKETSGHTLMGWVRFLLTLFILAVLLRSLVISPFNIPSRSMTPTMQVGDYLFAAKWPYGYSRYSFPFAPSFIEGRWGEGRPERGDIIVFRSPENDDSNYVKRVIGLPGDRVQVFNGEILLNGAIVARVRIEDYREPIENAEQCPAFADTTLEVAADGNLFCNTARYRETLPGGVSYDILDVGPTTADTTTPLTVPDGHYFVLGDDRDRSADSRFDPGIEEGVGLVAEEHIIGQAMVIFWSTDGTASWSNPISWFRAARWDRIGRSY